MSALKLILPLILIGCLVKSEAQVYNTEHFKIYYTSVDKKDIKRIGDTLEHNYARIVTDLQCRETVNAEVHLYPDTPAYREGVKPWVPNVLSWSSGLTLGDSVIHVLSPNAPKQGYGDLVHEFAHCVSRHINRKIANNPRWLWEAVAIFEAKQKVDPRTLPYLVNQGPPSLKQLNDVSDTTIYNVGYLLCEYLVETKGKSVLNALIKNNGNIRQTLNMDDEAFIKQWFAFVKKKYGI